MRSVSTAQEDVLNAPAYDVHLRVEVEDDDGNFVSLSDLAGGDWVQGVEWGHNLDQPVPEIRVQLRRDQASSESLAPLMEESSFNVQGASTAYAPLLDAGRELKLYTATVAAGAAAPSTGALDFMAHAEIDEVQWGRSPIQLVCRSKIMSHLADRWIETPTEYGSVDGVAIETVIQAILDDWTDGTTTLWTPTSPSFNILLYRQQRMSVLSAITQLVQLIGWDCREVWDDGTSAFRLKLYEPNRAASTGDVDWSFDGSKYYDVNRLDISRADVRNVVSVLYTSSGSTGLNSVTAQDTTSIARFGRRWMEIQEGDESSITSSSEAQALADAALADLADPLADQEIVLPYFWPAELQDYQEYLANGVHYSTDQLWSIYGLRHVLSEQQTRTRLLVRGKPAGQYLNWLTLGGGVASTGLPLALTNIVLDSRPATVFSLFGITVEQRYVFVSWHAASTLVRAIECHTYTVESTIGDWWWTIDTSSEVSGRESIAWLPLTTPYSTHTIRTDATPYNSTKVSTDTKLSAAANPGSSHAQSTSTGARGPTLTDRLETLEDSPEFIEKVFLSTAVSSSGAPPTSTEWYYGNYTALGPGLTVSYLHAQMPQYALHYTVSTTPVSTGVYGDPSPGQLHFQVTTSSV